MFQLPLWIKCIFLIICIGSLRLPLKKEFCWWNVKPLPIFKSKWYFGFGGKGLTYSQELQEHAVFYFLFQYQIASYFQVIVMLKAAFLMVHT